MCVVCESVRVCVYYCMEYVYVSVCVWESAIEWTGTGTGLELEGEGREGEGWDRMGSLGGKEGRKGGRVGTGNCSGKVRQEVREGREELERVWLVCMCVCGVTSSGWKVRWSERWVRARKR